MNSISTSIFLLPRGWKAVLRHFFHFQGVGKPFWRFFFHFQGVGKPFWGVFYHFQGVGKLFWGISSVSAVAEMQFSSFFVFRPWPKRCFYCFLFIWALGKPFFTVFCSSEVSESHFFLIFCSSETSDGHFFSFYPSLHRSPDRFLDQIHVIFL